jgi:RNA polymerase sigma-70 factor (ECF subfamily)
MTPSGASFASLSWLRHHVTPFPTVSVEAGTGAAEDEVMVTTACWTGDERPRGAQTDEDLLQRFRRENDPAAFESLVHRYEADLFGYLRRYLGSIELAEDVFQATFLQVYMKSDRFDAGRRFRPWLYAIATNQAIDAQRRNRRHRMASLDRRIGHEAGDAALAEMLASHEPVCDSQLEDQEARAWAKLAVADLPEPMKTVLVLVYDRGLKYREAADMLGIPLGTVKSRLNAAIHRLSECWRSKCLGRGHAEVAVVTA